MAAYKDLVGQKITVVTSNPPEPKTGQMWYNSTTGTLKGLGILEAWVAGTSTATSKQRSGGCGTQTAGLNCGGFAAPPNGAAHDGTEEYNGSGWSTGGTLNTARGNTKLVGTQTAAVFFGQGGGGQPQSGVTEEYNGTSWTTVNPMANAINYRSGCGIQTAALATGGNVPSTNRSNLNEEYDGTNWSTGGALPQKQSSQGQAGTQTAAINSFGYTNNPVPGNSGDTLNAISVEYDGSSWTAGPNGNGVVELTGYAMGSGIQTNAIFAGAPSTNSCKYDGTTFTVGPALAIAQDSASHGSTSASDTWIAKGSPVPSVGNRVQDFNSSTNVVTAAAWASAPSLNTARDELGSALNAPAPTALAMGGYNGSPPAGLSITEEYNGSAWSESGDLNNITWQMAGAGTQTAAVSMGGAYNPFTIMANTEEYNGSTWTPVNAMPTATWGAGGTGSQTAALVFGGNAPGIVSTTFEYDGTNYSPSGAMNTARTYTTGFGIQTAALCAGGNTPSKTGATEEYNGSTWTSSGSMLTARDSLCGGGAQTDGLVFTGSSGPGTPNVLAVTEGYDGTAWSTRPNVSTARIFAEGTAGTTSSAAAIIYGGAPGGGPFISNSEEFTAETTAANITDFTTS